jgi:hypothetical protein
MVFGSTNNTCSFTFNGGPIEIVKKYKYVGTIFSSHGPLFNDHVASSLASSSKALFKYSHTVNL